jgi:leucyl aminopeptidase
MASHSIPIFLLHSSSLKDWLKTAPKSSRQWVDAHGFSAEPGSVCLIPSDTRGIDCVLYGIRIGYDHWCAAGIQKKLPPGKYHFATDLRKEDADRVALGYLLGLYQFNKYKKPAIQKVHIELPKRADRAYCESVAKAIGLVRDLINTPANDMGPAALAEAASRVAKQYKATCKIIVGDQLLKQNYPTIHMVGRASSDAPRLIDISWGNPKHPKVTLIGKGVCFDSGGLDIKPSSGMKLMKKDMGGAALVLGVASLIMEHKLPVRLRILIPAVENSVAGNAFRPLDVVKTRKGLTVEIGNTDAEGRLILCDALTEADDDAPDLMIDCATLTGAARIALGTDIPAVFSNNDVIAQELVSVSQSENDPLWQLPLWSGYRDMLRSPVADLNNAPDSSYGGAITAALFLKEFVSKSKNWIHIDTMAWNLSDRPGRPAGGEALGLRAVYHYIAKKYSK